MAPRRLPRRPKEATGCSQGVPRRPQEGPRRPQDGAKMAQDGAKMASCASRLEKVMRRRVESKNVEKQKENHCFWRFRGSRRVPHRAQVGIKLAMEAVLAASWTTFGRRWPPRGRSRRKKMKPTRPEGENVEKPKENTVFWQGLRANMGKHILDNL